MPEESRDAIEAPDADIRELLAVWIERGAGLRAELARRDPEDTRQTRSSLALFLLADYVRCLPSHDPRLQIVAAGNRYRAGAERHEEWIPLAIAADIMRTDFCFDSGAKLPDVPEFETFLNTLSDFVAEREADAAAEGLSRGLTDGSA